MSFKILSSLTNKRPTKNVGDILSVGTTNGTIRISKSFAEKVGLAAGDFLNIIQAEVEGGLRTYISKGSYVEGGEKVGSKLAEIGSALQCSAAAAYQTLGGNGEENQIYAILGFGEGEEGEVEELDGTRYYPIEFVKAVKKSARTRKEGVEGVEVEEEDDDDIFVEAPVAETEDASNF